ARRVRPANSPTGNSARRNLMRRARVVRSGPTRRAAKVFAKRVIAPGEIVPIVHGRSAMAIGPRENSAATRNFRAVRPTARAIGARAKILAAGTGIARATREIGARARILAIVLNAVQTAAIQSRG